MNPGFLWKHIFAYLKDSTVDIRIRMIYFLEYVAVFVGVIGTVAMIMLKQPIVAMVPNFVLLAMSFLGLYLSHVRKKYDLSALFIIIACANIALPWMFFSAGGNESGMQIWFLFGVVVSCMMAKGKSRVWMAAFTTIEDVVCIFIGHFYPHLVIPLVGENAVFVDQVQSFAIVCICLTVVLSIYIATYENQRKKLEEQSIELRNLMQTDALTGAFNRRAYYDEINMYKNGKAVDDLVIVAMDVNGLKKVNDLLGHSAGDEYIQNSAKVIERALGQFGHIFRTGGDEFMALLHCSAEEAKQIETRLKENIAQLDAAWADQMSIAIGIVCCGEHPGVELTELEKIADKKMYENKAAFYRQKGIDRRG